MGNTCTPVVDSCQCMAKPLQYCKVISLQLNKFTIKNKTLKKKSKGYVFFPYFFPTHICIKMWSHKLTYLVICKYLTLTPLLLHNLLHIVGFRREAWKIQWLCKIIFLSICFSCCQMVDFLQILIFLYSDKFCRGRASISTHR